MKNNKKNRFSSWFDNLMAGGTMALIRVLLVVMVAMLLVSALVIVLIWPEEGFFGSIWISLTRLLDSGTFADDFGQGALYTLLMVFITLLGIFITSTLTGIICNVIDEKFQNLRRGRSAVVENGHVIILGTAGGLYTIISELIEANSNHPHEAVVIMDNKDDKDVMEEKIHARFPDTKTTQIVCRCGSITDVADLQICSFDTCMSVIVNAESDAETLKCILVVTKLLKECGNDKAYITAVIRDEQNKEAAELAGEGYVEVLSYKDVISRIIAHSGRYAGLSRVYTDLFDMDGSEFYIEEHADAAGKTLAELNRYFPISSVCGFVTAEGEVLLNPEPDYRCKPDDRGIVFAEDDGVSKMDAAIAPVMEDVILPEYVKEPLERTDLLILGCNSKLPRILQEEDHYVAPGSKVVIALSEEQFARKDELEHLNLGNIETKIVACDFYNRSQLEALIKPGLSVLVLAEDNEEDDEDTIEEKDSRILMILLQLKYLSEKKDYKLNITSEMLRVENQELAQFANVNDFVVSSNITSLIVTQICQSRELKLIFEELLRENGSEIYVRPAGNYVKLGVKTNIYTACEAAARQREVMIGYRRREKDGDGVEIVTNPPKAEEIVFEETDGLVVIAVD